MTKKYLMLYMSSIILYLLKHIASGWHTYVHVSNYLPISHLSLPYCFPLFYLPLKLKSSSLSLHLLFLHAPVFTAPKKFSSHSCFYPLCSSSSLALTLSCTCTPLLRRQLLPCHVKDEASWRRGTEMKKQTEREEQGKRKRTERVREGERKK